MPGSWDYREPSLWDRRRVGKPARCELAGFLSSSGPALFSGTGALLFNSGEYNRSVLISAIRVRTREVTDMRLPAEPNGSNPGNSKPAILRNFETSVDTKRQAGRRFLGASRPDSKQQNGAHGGVCAPQPSPAARSVRITRAGQAPGPARQVSSRSVVRPSCL